MLATQLFLRYIYIYKINVRSVSPVTTISSTIFSSSSRWSKLHQISSSTNGRGIHPSVLLESCVVGAISAKMFGRTTVPARGAVFDWRRAKAYIVECLRRKERPGSVPRITNHLDRRSISFSIRPADDSHSWLTALSNLSICGRP